VDLINALRAAALTMPVCRQRPPALPARSARPARWPLRRPTRPRPEPIPSARVQELRPPSPAFMSGPFVRRGLPEVARSVAACAYRWITWRCWGEVMTSSPALTMPVTTSTGAGSPSTAWTSATCSAGKGLTRADLVCVALDTLAPKKGAGRFYYKALCRTSQAEPPGDSSWWRARPDPCVPCCGIAARRRGHAVRTSRHGLCTTTGTSTAETMWTGRGRRRSRAAWGPNCRANRSCTDLHRA